MSKKNSPRIAHQRCGADLHGLNKKENPRESVNRQSESCMVEEWGICKLSDLSTMKSGLGITEASISESGKYPCYGGNGLRGYTSEYTNDGQYALIGRQGALCGNVVLVSGRFFASEHAIVVTPKTNTDIAFLSYVLTNIKLNQYSESSAQPGLSVKKVLDIECFVPNKKDEQRAIADVLSDTDSYIAALEKLIAKKKAVKQGAMQQLLTGRRRLINGPRINADLHGLKIDIISDNPRKSVDKQYGVCATVPEGWEIIELGTNGLAIFDYDNLGSNTAENYAFNYITLENVDQGKLLGVINCIFSTASPRARRKIQQNDILISTVRPNLHSHYLVKEPVKNIICSTGFCVIATNEEKLHNQFLYHLFFSTIIDEQIEAIITGSNYPAISSSDIKKLQIPLPPLSEQTAIAAVLSDMDAEIEALTAKLNKAKAVKQGMMQELLTGRIRLKIRDTSEMCNPRKSVDKKQSANCAPEVRRGFTRIK